MKPDGVAVRLESVVAAVESLIRAEHGDNDFLADAARKRVVAAMDAWALHRFPQLRGKVYGARRMIVCRECGRLRPHQAKGMCGRCYDAHRKPVVCCECGKEAPGHCGGRCWPCYQRERRRALRAAERRAA